MPILPIEAAFAKGIQGRACDDSEIGDHKARVMGGEVVVDRIREDTVSIIKEEDDEQGDDGDKSKLQSGSKLGDQVSMGFFGWLVGVQFSWSWLHWR